MKHILIIDDDEVLSGLLQMTLELEGYSVATAADGSLGLSAVASSHVDLIVLDLVMPKIDGIKFLRLLNDQDGPRPPIIILSSALESDSCEQYRDLGVVDAARKPVEPRRLVAIIERALSEAA